MTPFDFRMARKTLGMTQRQLSDTLRLSEKNGPRTIRLWEAEGNTIPGPAQVAIEALLTGWRP